MRVSENSTLNTVRDSLTNSRLRMNNLQRQNATLKRVNTPSDDPTGNAKLMTIRNENLDNAQFERNANLAKTFLNYTDSALEEVTNHLTRLKELALGQASSAANGPESRIMVAEEVKNIINELGTIVNRRLGDRYIFSGYKTSTQPFDTEGNYSGDDGRIMVEVQKDVFVGLNLPGHEVFHGVPQTPARKVTGGPSPASADEKKDQNLRLDVGHSESDIFRTLDTFRTGLMTNDIEQIRSVLEPLDKIRDRVITARAEVGARTAGIDTAITNMGKRNVFNAELGSTIEDADIIQVVSDMAREESVLRASLQASNKLIQPTLLEFLR